MAFSRATSDALKQAAGASTDSAMLLAWLLAHGATENLAKRAAKRTERLTVADVTADPYVLGRVPHWGFAHTDHFAVNGLGVAQTDPRRIRGAVLHATAQLTTKGDACHSLARWEAAREMAAELLGFEVPDAHHALEGLDVWRGGGQGEAAAFVAPAWLGRAEDLVAAHFRIAAPDLTFTAVPGLTEEQSRAVCAAERNRACAWSGYAGTGKTYAIKALANRARLRNQRVILCALAGKAARRMEEVTGFPAATIHRTLGFQDGRFLVEVLAADLVVIDEASMVEANLLAHVVKRLRPTANLVLVGDPNQLPSIGAGAVLRDLVRHRPCPVVELKHIHRQAGVVRANALEVLQGRFPAASVSDDVSEWSVSDQLLASREDGGQVLAAALDVYRRWHAQDPEGLARGRYVLLAPMKGGPVGIDALNQEVRSMLQGTGADDGGRFRLSSTTPTHAPPSRFSVRDRVLWTQNDYDLELMNGTTGTVVGVDGNKLHVDWDDGRRINVDGRDVRVQLAYALTVHKAQGSEYDEVAVIVSRAHDIPMLDRSLLYTAVTRGKKRVTVLGDAMTMARAARRRNTYDRRTICGLRWGG